MAEYGRLAELRLENKTPTRDAAKSIFDHHPLSPHPRTGSLKSNDINGIIIISQ